MIAQDYSTQVAQCVRTNQIIVASMAACATALLIVTTASGPAQTYGQRTLVMTYTALGFATLAVIGSFSIAHLLFSVARKQIIRKEPPDQYVSDHSAFFATETGRLCGALATTTIIRCAMLEGAALLAVVAYWTESEQSAFCVAVFLISLLVAHIPSVSRTKRWLDRQNQMIERSRPLDAAQHRTY